jgi:hypothetical protein
LNHCFVAPLLHKFVDSLVYLFFGSLVHSFSCARILSCHFVGISAISFIDALHNLNRSWFVHLKNVPMGCWIFIVIFNFHLFKLLPRRVPGTAW